MSWKRPNAAADFLIICCTRPKTIKLCLHNHLIYVLRIMSDMPSSGQFVFYAYKTQIYMDMKMPPAQCTVLLRQRGFNGRKDSQSHWRGEVWLFIRHVTVLGQRKGKKRWMKVGLKWKDALWGFTAHFFWKYFSCGAYSWMTITVYFVAIVMLNMLCLNVKCGSGGKND